MGREVASRSKKRSCAIMQPTFIPWSGYFNLMTRVDDFVFLDDVQFARRSWQCRNKILLDGKPFMVSLRLQKGARERLIIDVPLHQDEGDDGWRESIGKTLNHTYSKHPCPESIEPALNALDDADLTMLAEFNMALIRSYIELLGLDVRLHRSSEMGVEGHRSERLAQICRKLDCQHYVSPVGAREYIEEDGIFSLYETDDGKLTVSFQDYVPGPYSQKGAVEFVSHLSIVDVLANLGVDASREYVRLGHCQKAGIAQ